MKYVLFGDERYIKEVIYVCEDLLGQYETVLYSEAEKLRQIAFDSECKVLLCAYEKETVISELQARQIVKEHYVFPEELFQKMDRIYLKLPEQRKVAIWGLGKTLEEYGEDLCVLADVYVDRNPLLQEKGFKGKSVYAPSDAMRELKDYFFLVTVGQEFAPEIAEELKKNGYAEHRDFCMVPMRYDRKLPSTMMKQVLNATSMKQFACTYGLRKIDFCPDGSLIPCCFYHMPVVIGNISGDTSVQEEWDSYKARIVKLSIINRTYTFCQEACPLFYEALKQPEYYPKGYAGFDYLDKGNSHIVNPAINIDKTCNLKCESCRQEYITKPQENEDLLRRITDKINEEVMPYADKVCIAGDGEVFYSKLYREMWINTTGKKRKGIIVKTNGLLFNEQNWKLLEEGYEHIELHVSIDAATKETYESIRRGGKWEILKKNMEFASRLRQENRLKAFWIFFVVQQKNYQECKEFVRLGVEWNTDAICFSRIVNWGTYSSEEFDENITLFDEDENGLRIREEYREYFQDEIFDLPNVFGLSHFRVKEKE